MMLQNYIESDTGFSSMWYSVSRHLVDLALLTRPNEHLQYLNARLMNFLQNQSYCHARPSLQPDHDLRLKAHSLSQSNKDVL